MNKTERNHLLISWATISVAFAFLMSGGLFSVQKARALSVIRAVSDTVFKDFMISTIRSPLIISPLPQYFLFYALIPHTGGRPPFVPG